MRPAAEWVDREERGSSGLIRFMVRLSLLLGRGPSRVLLRGIAAYFFVTGGRARRACAAFLARVHGRPATWAEQYRTFFAFAATIHDRIYLLKDRFELFDIERHGVETIERGGAVLMGAHFGSFDALRACGRHLGGFDVAMAMYQANAQKVIAALAAIAPHAARDIVPLGRVESMLELSTRLEAGALVGVLADRTFGPEPTIDVEFLGAPAAFPTGPMRMAAAMRQRVFFMAGMYRGGNRYEMRFEPLADFRDLEGLTRAERDARVHAAIHADARRLEHYARSAPDNWFNFFDFWAHR
jgi:predicted LPLAT superfamily acyltransferase